MIKCIYQTIDNLQIMGTFSNIVTLHISLRTIHRKMELFINSTYQNKFVISELQFT